MVYDDIDSSEIEAGDPVKQELFNKIKENFTNHESRLVAVESGVTTAFMDWPWNVWGDYSDVGIISQRMITRIPLNITISSGRLLVHTAGSSGTTEIDFLFKRGGGSWTSIFSTKPSVAFGAGSNAISSNSVLNLSNVSLQSGDLFRMDITAVQTGGIGLTGFVGFSQT